MALLGFIEQTGANPIWLLSGEGPRYRRSSDEAQVSQLSPVELIRRGLEELEALTRSTVVIGAENLPSDHASSFVAVALYPLERNRGRHRLIARAEGYVLAYRQWLPNPAETIATRLSDDAMHPIFPLARSWPLIAPSLIRASLTGRSSRLARAPCR